MTDVKERLNEISELFCNSKQKIRTYQLNALNSLRCCNCGHKSRIQEVRDKMFWFRRMTRFYQLVLSILSLVLMLASYGVWLTRHYNRASMFGGCNSSFFWPFDDCPIVF